MTSALLLRPAVAGPGALFPEVIPLPNGFQPEGIAAGVGLNVYAGAIGDGAVVRAQVLTGEVEPVVPPQAGRSAAGLKFDLPYRRLFVSGGATGQAYVYDAGSGLELVSYQLGPASGSFINDVVITRRGAYFTDSFRPVLYRLPFSVGGALPTPSDAQEIALGGDFVQVPGAFNANGIAAIGAGKELLLINSTTGILYKVDPDTGVATEVDLGGATLNGGDGIWLRGHTLYVVQNALNQVTLVKLSGKYERGDVINVITSAALRFPTTVTGTGPYLYVVNARFNEVAPGTAGPTDEFEIVRLPRLR
ncbi:hypothetical protein Tel_12865 [Candidatus Tenderia electrophaga]|jgi:hypothetical protein|uniref:Superoxide dismutase n=1 Tax=Candidatus Tenderia electrophaga TaxID=1748243 RepID=A0A0S2TFS5_9GAMM|nr:hypothetical protein Tel_12865 [Candidatus Tenderia electrophaga]